MTQRCKIPLHYIDYGTYFYPTSINYRQRPYFRREAMNHAVLIRSIETIHWHERLLNKINMEHALWIPMSVRNNDLISLDTSHPHSSGTI